jgi:hypothetical protein
MDKSVEKRDRCLILRMAAIRKGIWDGELPVLAALRPSPLKPPGVSHRPGVDARQRPLSCRGIERRRGYAGSVVGAVRGHTQFGVRGLFTRVSSLRHGLAVWA